MKKRNPFVVIFLIFATFFVYGYIYAFLTTAELFKKTGNKRHQPALDFGLTMLVCQLYAFYIPYRNQKIIDNWHLEHGTEHQPKAKMVALLSLGPIFLMASTLILIKLFVVNPGLIEILLSSLFVVLGCCAALYVYQNEQNDFADVQVVNEVPSTISASKNKVILS